MTKKIVGSALAWLLWAVSLSAASVQIFSDDFNDNSKDTAKWGSDFDFQDPGGVLTETSQRLEFTSPSSGFITRVRPWIQQSPTYGQDWEIIVDVVNTRTFSSPSDGASMGVAVQNPSNPSQVITVEIYAYNGGSAANGFLSSMLNSGTEIGAYDSPDLGVNQGKVRLTFDSAAKIVRAYYKTTGNWVLLASYGISASGGGTTANLNWGMSSGSAFNIGVYGFSGAVAVSAGQVYADNFQLALNTQDSSTTTSDVTSYLVAKSQEYLQTGTGAPTLQTNNPFYFNASASTPVATNTLISASVRIPGGATRGLTNVNSDGNDFSQNFASQAAMDAIYSNGTYTMSINTTHDGSRTNLALALTGNTYPNAPRVSNFTAAQAVNAATDFTVTWDAFAGGTVSDFVQLDVKSTNGTVFRTPNIGIAGVLNGTATSAVIPAGTLTAGQSYTARLRFAKAVTRDTNSYPGATGLALYSIRTTFPIATLATAAANLDFKIAALLTNNSTIVDHNGVTGDDRGGIAVSTNQVFVTGDSATARFNVTNLASGTSLGRIVDGLCANLKTETVYALGNGTNALTSSGGTVTTLIELDGTTGQPTGAVIPLSQSITMGSANNGIFSGYGRVAIYNYNDGHVYDILLPAGTVTDTGGMARPNWYGSESWAVWGVAEFFDGALHLVYRDYNYPYNNITRARVPDGASSTVASFSDLGDMASFTVSPSRGRWYFHHEGSSQFGGSAETLGYADAVFNVGTNNPPAIVLQPASQTVLAGGSATLTVAAGGSLPLGYQWRFNGSPIVGETSPGIALFGVTTNQAGSYSVLVTNSSGSAVSSNATLTVVPGVSFEVTSLSVAEGDSGATGAVLTVSLSIPSTQTVTVAYSTVDNTAIAGSDYAATNGLLTFPPGVTNRTITVPVLGDVLDENDEYFYVRLLTATNAFLVVTEAWVTVLDNDPLPVLRFTNATVTEGHLGVTNVSLALSLSAPSGRGSQIYFQTLDDTAAAGGDFAATNGYVYFDPGVTSVVVVLRVNGDIQVESNETFFADFYSPYNLDPATNRAVVTIVNDDGLPGQIDHFAWSAIGATQMAGVPFPAALTAKDYFNNTVSNFSAAVALNLSGGGTVSTNLLGLATYENTYSGYYTLGYSFTPAVNMTVTHVRHIHGTKISIWTDTGTLLASQNVTSTPGSWVETPLSTPLLLTAGMRYRVAAYTGGGSYYYHSVLPSAFAQGTIDGSYYASGDAFPSISSSGLYLVDLRYVMGDLTSATLTPTNATPFISGVWTGMVTVSRAATNVTLRASDAVGHAGVSDALEVLGPPVITAHPTNQTLLAGENVSFSVQAEGTAPLIYQWRKDGTPVGGATNSNHSLAGAQAGDSGVYSVVVSNAYGTVTSSNAVLTVVDAGNLDFQITSLLTTGSAVVDHDALTGDDRGGIAVSASQVFITGDYATARFDAAPLTNGASLGLIVDGLCSDLRTETVYALGIGTNAVTSAGGTVTTLIELDGTTGQPTGALINLSQPIPMTGGNNGIFSGYGRVVIYNGFESQVYDVLLPSGAVIVRGAMTRPNWYGSESWSVWGVAEFFDGALHLAYRDYNYPYNNIARARVPDGAVTNVAVFSSLGDMASFTVSPARGRWYFHYEGSAQFGGSSETLGYADATFHINFTNPPSIYLQPASQTIGVGSNVTFNVGASGVGLSYVWRRNGVTIPGATNSVYTTNSVRLADSGGVFSCVVSNAYGTTLSSNAVLTVVGFPPVVIGQPAGQTVPVGGSVTFNVTATGTAPLSYAWRRNGVAIPGATNSTYTTNNLQFADSGQQFSCVVSNAFGNVSSSNALLSVVSGVIDYVTFDELPVLGSDYIVPVPFHGLTWSNFYTLNAPNYGSLSGYLPGMISASNVAYNGYGYAASIESATPFAFQSAYLTAAWNDNLQVVVLGYISANLAYSNLYVLSATNATLVNFNFSGVTRVDFTASGGTPHPAYGSGSASHFVMDNAVIVTFGGTSMPPAIVTHPADLTVMAGDSAAFNVLVSGSTPFSYQWRSNGVNLAGATNNFLNLSNVQSAWSGTGYSVVVTNAYGSVTSAVATLTVYSLPDGVFPVATGSGTVEIVGGGACSGTTPLFALLSGTNVCVQLMTAAGAPSGSLITVGRSAGFDGLPRVALGGGNYLVVWSDVFAGAGVTMFGQLVSPAGALVGSAFPLLASPGAHGFQYLQSIAFDGAKFLIVWQDGNDGAIYGQFVTTAGALAGAEFLISAQQQNGNSAVVAFGRTNYLVAWQSNDGPTGDTNRTFGAFVSTNGVAGGIFQISETASTDQNPLAIAFDGFNYFVIWNRNTGPGYPAIPTWNLCGRLVSPAGVFNSAERTLVTEQGLIPSLAFDGQHYLMSWSYNTDTTNADKNLHYQFFDRALNPASSIFTVFAPLGADVPLFGGVVSNRNGFTTAATLGQVQVDGTGEILGLTSGDIYAGFISGFPRGTFPIATATNNEFGVATAFDGTNYLVGIQGNASDSNEISAQLFTAGGELIGPRILTGRFGGIPAVAFDGANYLMVWEDDANYPNDDIYGQFISPSGALVRTPFAISSAGGHQKMDSLKHLVFDGGNYLVIWSDGRNGDTNNDIYAQRISPGGALVGAEIPVAVSGLNEREPSIAFDGTNYLAVWQSRRSGATELWDTYGKFISQAGVPGGAFLISQKPSSSYNPTGIAFDGTNYFVTWPRDIGPGYPSPNDWDIYARIVTRAGTFAGSEFAITAAAGSQPFATVVFSGTGFLVSWIDGPSGSGRNRFYNRTGAPLSGEFTLFGAQGVRYPLSAFLFDGTRLLATTAYLEGQFNNGDVYGTFVSPLDIPVPLAITEQPESQLLALGRPLSLSVSVVGLEPISYQWRFNGTNIPGATNASLNYPSAQAGFSGDFTVVAANYAGSVTSDPATVVVLGPPGILVAPVNQTVARGSTVTFSVTASGVPPLRYQWRLNGANLAGATNSTLTLVNVQNTNAGIYSVVVANAVGATVTSAKLLIGGGRSLLADNFADRITTNSLIGEVEGSTVSATREIGEPSHAGRVGGHSMWLSWTAPTNGIVTIETLGSGFDTLLAVYTGTSLANLTEVASNDDAGGFFASRVKFYATSNVTYHIAVDGLGGASGDVELEWELEPGSPSSLVRFALQPQSQTVTNGANVLFAAMLSAANPSNYSYQWYRNGQPVTGATSTNLLLVNAQIEQVGAYRLVAIKTDETNKVFQSDIALLEIQTPDPVVTAPRRSHDKFQDLFLPDTGGGASLQAALQKPRPAFVTVSAGALGTQIFDNFGATTEQGEPTIAGAIGGASRWFGIQAASSGTMVVDTVGSDFDTVLGVYTGTDLLNLVEVASDDNSAPDGIRSKVSFAATSGTTYLVLVDGVNGAQGTIALNWSLGTAPQITLSPAGASVPAGGSVTISAAAAGTPAPAYQWRLNGVAISGATNASLTLDDFQTASEGSYSVVASNTLGTAASLSAFLAVDVPAQLGSVGKGAGGAPFQMQLVGTARQNYAIQSTTNLLSTNTVWTPLIVTNSFSGVLDFIDAGATNGRRFYRAVKQ